MPIDPCSSQGLASPRPCKTIGPSGGLLIGATQWFVEYLAEKFSVRRENYAPTPRCEEDADFHQQDAASLCPLRLREAGRKLTQRAQRCREQRKFKLRRIPLKMNLLTGITPPSYSQTWVWP